MTTKEYLQQAFVLDRKLKLNKLKIEAMRAALYGKGFTYDSDGSQHIVSDNEIEKAIVRVMDYQSELDSEIRSLVEKRLGIEAAINLVPDNVQREILTRRYLLYQKWELIAVEMGYDLRWIHRLHGKALAQLTIESH